MINILFFPRQRVFYTLLNIDIHSTRSIVHRCTRTYRLSHNIKLMSTRRIKRFAECGKIRLVLREKPNDG